MRPWRQGQICRRSLKRIFDEINIRRLTSHGKVLMFGQYDRHHDDLLTGSVSYDAMSSCQVSKRSRCGATAGKFRGLSETQKVLSGPINPELREENTKDLRVQTGARTRTRTRTRTVSDWKLTDSKPPLLLSFIPRCVFRSSQTLCLLLWISFVQNRADEIYLVAAAQQSSPEG